MNLFHSWGKAFFSSLFITCIHRKIPVITPPGSVHTREHGVGTPSRDKPLHVCCMGHMPQGQYTSGCTWSGLRFKNHRHHWGCLGTSFNGAFLLVHVYFTGGTVCKSSAHDVTLKLGSFCPCFVMHKFKPAEFHAACCRSTKFCVHIRNLIFRKNGDCHMRKTVATTCFCGKSPSVCWLLCCKILALSQALYMLYM